VLLGNSKVQSASAFVKHVAGTMFIRQLVAAKEAIAPVLTDFSLVLHSRVFSALRANTSRSIIWIAHGRITVSAVR